VSPEYEPAACNIGDAERRRRYRLAGASFLAAGAYLAAVLAFDEPRALLVGLVVPLGLGVELSLQGRRAFCAALGARGRYAFDGTGGHVADPAAREADRRYAGWLTVLGVLGGGALTVIVLAAVLVAGL
jgi:hypothetical protein